MSKMDDGALQAHYARDEERDRLGSGLGLVEFARTVEILQRALPPPGAMVADIGGGPGRYTDWLVEAGYHVIHRDLVARHVEQVASRHAGRVDTAIGDARSLDLADASVDAVLLLGPLYHLGERADRLRALDEARRVARGGGVVFVAAISRWAPRLHGMLVDHVHVRHPAFHDALEVVERSGALEPIYEGSFTGYTHTPDELREEMERADLHVESLLCVEAIAFALHDVDERMHEPEERALLLAVLRAVEAVPDLLGLGPHLLATARTP